MSNTNSIPDQSPAERQGRARTACPSGGRCPVGWFSCTDGGWVSAWRVELQNRTDGVYFFKDDGQAVRFAEAALEDAMVEEVRMPDGLYLIDRVVAEMMIAAERS